jgi:DNA-binding MarR family transcriptional regulator
MTTKLDAADVAGLRALYATQLYTQRDLAEIYGIHKGQVSRIVNRKSWAGEAPVLSMLERIAARAAKT